MTDYTYDEQIFSDFHKRALREFSDLIESVIASGAGDRTTALQWLTDEDTFYGRQDVEHWVYKQGILFTDEGRALAEELMSIVTISDWGRG
jgi:hypothetical protein